MKHSLLFLLALVFSAIAAERPRLCGLTDIGGDPDDTQSMIRLMVYANEFEIEGLIASAAGTPGELKEAVTRPERIREMSRRTRRRAATSRATPTAGRQPRNSLRGSSPATRSADWMRAEFPGMNYIIAKALPGRDKREGTYRGMYLGGDESLTSREWIEKNIRSKGPLGALYLVKTFTAPNPHGCMKEGDTPSWFFFLPTGGNDPADPTKPGWGGQYRKSDDGWWRDIPGSDPREAVHRWRPAFQADFARRMAWCVVE